eukprot:gene16473-biopygen8015
MVSGNIWAEARQRAGQEQTKGNIKEMQWSEGHWQNLGIASGKPWKTLEEPWEDLGRPWKTLGNPWKPLGKPWKALERPWNRPAADFWMTAAGAWAPAHRHGLTAAIWSSAPRSGAPS